MPALTSLPQGAISRLLRRTVKKSVWLDTPRLSDFGVDVTKLCDRDGYNERVQKAHDTLIAAADTLDKQTKVIQDLLAVLHPGAVGLISNEHGVAASIRANAAVVQAKELLASLQN